MDQKIFSLIVGIFFLLAGLLHLSRIIYGWDVTIGDFNVPLWLSWIGIVVAAVLSYHGFRFSK